MYQRVESLGLFMLEVMDKEPPLLQTAALYGTLCVFSFLLSRRRWWASLLLLPAGSLFAWIDFGELYDPYIAPAIIQEAGFGYFVAWNLLILSALVAPIVLAMLNRRAAMRNAPNMRNQSSI